MNEYELYRGWWILFVRVLVVCVCVSARVYPLIHSFAVAAYKHIIR